VDVSNEKEAMMRAQLKKIVLTVIVCMATTLLYPALDTVDAHHNSNHDAADDATPARQLLDVYECSRCHRLNTPHRLIGPSLWHLGQRRTAAEVRASLLDPDEIIVPGFPAGLMKKRLQEEGFYHDIERNPSILDRIVAYLTGTGETVPSLDDRNASASVDSPAPSTGFRIDTAAVTKKQFAAFMADDGYATKRYWDRIGWAEVIRRRHRKQPMGWNPTRDAASSQPLVGVNWYEADAYCRWVGKTLPTVEEWERACVKMPTWSDAPPHSELQWEWTADAIWKAAKRGNSRDHCTERVTAHRALDGYHTGFRCRAAAHR
jgi:hypothetical protein